MKYTLLIVLAIVFTTILLPSCRKCYICKTTCSTCIKRDTTGVILSQYSLCSDSNSYKTRIVLYGDSGYNCVSAPSNYSDDYCVNNSDASAQYLLYHEGNGKYTCTPN